MSAPPPLEIECAVIGALLYWPGAYEMAASEGLEPEHFVEGFLGDVYRWIRIEIEDNGARAGDVLQLACLRTVGDIDRGPRTVVHCIARSCAPIELTYAVRKLIEYREERDGRAG